ncbi:MAG TPA: uroporphyrinogen-III synthase [Acidimicrobiia bacterium]|nr:uroporphyrinogen-III synthase [Acidimicrobiia bacterium]
MTESSPLAGRCVGITADRRWRNQADLLEKLGGRTIHGPTLRTVDLSRDEALRRATLALIDDPPDFVVGSTGMGMAMWLQAADAWELGESLRGALRHGRVVTRGAKATSAMRRQGFEVAWQAPSETMDEVVDFLTGVGIGEARIALQLFDPGGHPSTAALADRCRELVEVPVYRWLMPDDPGPAERLIDAMCAGTVDAVTFTSQPAVHHLFRIAEGVGRADALRAACNDGLLPVCVGPVCADAALAEGIARPRWPDPPRLAAMVRLVASALGPGEG